MKYCTNCGAPSPDESRFCTSCGQAFPAPAEAPEAAPAPEAATAEPAAPEAAVPAAEPAEAPEVPEAAETPEAPEAAEVPEIPAPEAPKKKKTGLIVGLSVAALCVIGILVAAVMLLTGTPKRTVEKGCDKTAKALQELVGSTEDLEKAAGQLRSYAEQQVMDLAADMTLVSDGTTLSVSESMSYDGVNKAAALSGAFTVSADGEELSIDLTAYADDTSMTFQIPRLLDRNIQLGTKTLGLDLLHLQDLGLFQLGLDREDADLIQVDLFPDPTDSDLEGLFKLESEEQQAHLKALKESVALSKPQAVTLADQDLKAYALFFDTEAAKAVAQDLKDDLQTYMTRKMDAVEGIDFLAVSLEQALQNVEEALDGFASGENAISLLLNKRGYLAGIQLRTADGTGAILLAGEKNPWNRILFLEGEGADAEITASASLTSADGVATLSFDAPELNAETFDEVFVQGASKIPDISTYEAATGTFTFVTKARDEVFNTITVRLYPDGDDTVFSFTMDPADEDIWAIDLFDFKCILRPISADPAPLSGEALALGKANENDLIDLLNGLYEKVMNDPDLAGLLGFGY